MVRGLQGKVSSGQGLFFTQCAWWDGFEPLQNHISCPSPNSQNRIKTKSIAQMWLEFVPKFKNGKPPSGEKIELSEDESSADNSHSMWRFTPPKIGG